MTKNHLARLITMARMNLDDLPDADNFHVVLLAQERKPVLENLLQKAIAIFYERPAMVKNLNAWDLPHHLFIR